MRTTASLAAFVTLMAVAGSNGAPIGTPNDSSARSVARAHGQVRDRNVPPVPPISVMVSTAPGLQSGSGSVDIDVEVGNDKGPAQTTNGAAARARGQLRDRNVLPVPPNSQDVSYTVDAPNVKCGECREGGVNKVSANVTEPLAGVVGGPKDVKNKAISTSSSRSINIDVDLDGDEGPGQATNGGAPTNGPTKGVSASVDIDVDAGNHKGTAQPEKPITVGVPTNGNLPTNGPTKSPINGVSGSVDIDVNAGNHESPTRNGKTGPPTGQQPCDNPDDVAEGVRAGLKVDSNIVDDKARDAVAKVEGKLGQIGVDATAAISTTNDGAHKLDDDLKGKIPQIAGGMSDADIGLHADVNLDAKNRLKNVGKLDKLPNGEVPKNPADCEDRTTVEIGKGIPSVSSSVLRR